MISRSQGDYCDPCFLVKGKDLEKRSALVTVTQLLNRAELDLGSA